MGRRGSAARSTSRLPASNEYGTCMALAEDVAAGAVQAIVQESEKVLTRKYFERKSFSYAAEVGEQNVIAGVNMCFVPHEVVSECSSDWAENEEPERIQIDPWARMCTHLNDHHEDPTPALCRRKAKAGAAALLPKSLVERARSGPHSSNALKKTANVISAALLLAETDSSKDSGLALRSRPPSASAYAASQVSAQDSIARKRRAYNVRQRDPRAIPLAQHHQVSDPEEDRLRHEKFAADFAKKKEAARQEALRIEEEQEELRRQQELERIAQEGPATFDSSGRVIYIHSPNIANLPNVQEEMMFEITTEPTDEAAAAALATASVHTQNSSAQQQQVPSQRRASKSKSGKAAGSTPLRKAFVECRDGYTQPDGFQPSPLETVEVSAGVVLEARGRKKTGPPLRRPGEDDRMSFKEFRRWQAVETIRGEATRSIPSALASRWPKDMSGNVSPSHVAWREQESEQCLESTHRDAQGSPLSGAGTAVHSASAPHLASKTTQAATAAATLRERGPQELETSSEVTQMDAESLSAANDGEDCVGARTSPKAPARSTRLKTSSASVGHLPRPPRAHVAPLGSVKRGGPAGGPVQPPLGATMGHGICRGLSLQDAFYFPAESLAGRAKLSARTAGTSSSAASPRLRSSTTPRRRAASSAGTVGRGQGDAPARPASATVAVGRRANATGGGSTGGGGTNRRRPSSVPRHGGSRARSRG